MNKTIDLTDFKLFKKKSLILRWECSFYFGSKLIVDWGMTRNSAIRNAYNSFARELSKTEITAADNRVQIGSGSNGTL